MDAEFEERQFEAHLNVELAVDQRLIYVPGQAFEWHLGIDAALWSIDPRLWRLFNPFVDPLPGRLLGNIWRYLDVDPRSFPRFACNVFLQHKRPEYLKRASSRQWASWGKPYYRFRIVPHQQQTLEVLERRVARRGIVSYSCPAFHRLETLWQHVSQRKLVENTNFVQPGKLNGHYAYTFVSPGTRGRANPDHEDIESADLRERLAELRHESNEDTSAKQFLFETARIIDDVVDEAPPPGPFKEMAKWLDEHAEEGVQRSVGRILAFCYLTSISWSIAIARP